MDTAAKTPTLDLPYKSNTADLAPATELPELVVDESNLPGTARALADRLACSPNLFERGADIVKVARTDHRISTLTLNAHAVVNEAHAVCRPVLHQSRGGDLVTVPVTLPQRVANLLLNQAGTRQFRVLRGISLAPLLSEDGSIRCAPGYDEKTGFWCECGQLAAVPERPTQEQASEALTLIRATFATFPFADAEIGAASDTAVVDPSCSPSAPLRQIVGLPEGRISGSS